MRRGVPPPPEALTRRRFLGLAPAVVGAWIVPAWAAPGDGAAGEPGAGGDAEHGLVLRVPRVTRNGAKVPILVEMALPLTPAHHVATVRVANPGDPIPGKGTFHLTPANGLVRLGFQARMHEGSSTVVATAECSRHGALTASSPIEIPPGAGGCGGGAPELGRARGDDVAPPVIRIPELVAGRAIRPGELVHVQLKMRHPNRTGLVFRDGRFVRESAPLHLRTIELFYGRELVSRLELTPALSDDPLVTVGLLARAAGTVRAVVTNSRGQRFEATHELRAV
jgi:predicted secreted protein